MFTLVLIISFINSYESIPEKVYGKQGSFYLFVCPYKMVAYQTVLWSFVNKTGSDIRVSDGNYTVPTNPAKDRVFIFGDFAAGEYNLNLTILQESDEGVYTCSVRYSNTAVQTKSYSMELLAAPSSFTLQDVTTDKKIIGTEGKTLTLRCTATGGKPPPLVTITVDNVGRSSAEQSVEYTTPPLQRQHDKQSVQCNVNSSALNLPWVTTANLYLNLNPLQPTFSVDPVSTEETKPLIVFCTSFGSRPVATFRWTIGLENVTSSSTTQSLHNTADDTYTVTSVLTYNVDRIYNGQTITCTANNIAAPNGVQTSKTLDVKFAPDITVTNITYNQNTATRTVTCIPYGNPTTYTYYRWQHKSTYGVLIRELFGGQNGVLILPNDPVENVYQDSGEYVCTASNGITGKDGRMQQSGSGYANVNAQPAFINGNKDTEYGELGSDVTIHVYLFSFPKYTSVKWYKSKIQILQTDKYAVSESRAIVNDTFHGTVVQLDGYRVTLTVNNLVESDFNVSYRVELSNGVDESVVHTTLLWSASAPQTPLNLTVRSTESSIEVQWAAGYNGGQEQTFYLQYRRFGSIAWVTIKIPYTKQTAMQTYTLSELQDGILFELMMYAENIFKKSLPTETETIATIKDNRLSSSEAVTRGVAGGLSAVILLMFIIIIILLLSRNQGTNRQKSEKQYSRWSEEASNPITKNCKDEQTDTVYEKDKQKIVTGSSKEYETLGMKDNPNTYSELLTPQGKQSEKSANEYETLSMAENPNTCSESNGQQGMSVL